MSFELAFEPIISKHVGKSKDGKYDYTTTVSEVIIPDAGGNPAATFYSFAYVRDDQPPGTRPVVFIFSGGPGASSLFLHMGGWGPVSAVLPGSSTSNAAPYRAVVNEHSLLDTADLVFIDPPGTGYARILPAGKQEDFYGVNQDSRATSMFIRDWLARNGRWGSPKFVMGESYGTVRATMLSRDLGGMYSTGALHGLSLNGVILLSQGLNSCFLGPGDFYYAFLLPSQAALAWHHGRVEKGDRTLEQVLATAQEFAQNTLLPALFKGSSLRPEDAKAVADQLEALTAIPAPMWVDMNLRIDAPTHAATLLASEQRWFSLYDGRFTFAKPGHAPDPIGDDPALMYAAAACSSAFHQHLVGDLGVQPSGEYSDINFAANSAWDWRVPEFGPPVSFNVTPVLAASMQRNPGLRLFVGSGAYDQITPWGSAEYMLSHGNFPLGRVEHHCYPAGHFPHIGADDLPVLTSDVRKFVLAASGQS